MEIKILVLDFDARGNRKEIFRRVLKIDSLDNFPFTSIVESFKFLYKDKIVEFSTLL